MSFTVLGYEDKELKGTLRGGVSLLPFQKTYVYTGKMAGNCEKKGYSSPTHLEQKLDRLYINTY